MEGLRLDAHRPMTADNEGPRLSNVVSTGYVSPQAPSRRNSQWSGSNGNASRENQGSSGTSQKRQSVTAWEESQVLSLAPLNQTSTNVSSPKASDPAPKKPSMQRSPSMHVQAEASSSKVPSAARERRGRSESFSPRTQMELMDHPLGEFLLPILPPHDDSEDAQSRLPLRTSNVKHYYGGAAKRRPSYQGGGAPVAPVLPVKRPPSLAVFLESCSSKPDKVQNAEADAVASKERIAEKIAERRQSYAGLGLRESVSGKRSGARSSVRVSANPRRASEGPANSPPAVTNKQPYEIKPRKVWTIEESFRTVRETGADFGSADFPTEGEARWLGSLGGLEWRPCMLLGYDKSEQKYWVQWLAPRVSDSDVGPRRFQVARMNVRVQNFGGGERSWKRREEGTGGVEGRLGRMELQDFAVDCSRGGISLAQKDPGSRVAVLAELAEEYVGEARQLATREQQGEDAEDGDVPESFSKWPRPVPHLPYSYSDLRAGVANRTFLCQPSLQPTLLEMAHLLEALSQVPLFDCRRRILTPTEARAHQSKVLKDGARYIREHLVEEMVDSLALGLSRWTQGMGEGAAEQQTAKLLRWANFKAEEALCTALQSALLNFTELFVPPRGAPTGGAVFEVGMSMRGDGQLELQAHPGVLATFSGHLLDDLEESLRNTPAFCPSEDRFAQKGPKIPRPALARAAASAVLRARSAVRTSIDAAMELLKAGAGQLSQDWASKVGEKTDNRFGGDDTSKKSPLGKVESLKEYLGRLQEAEKTVLQYDGKVYGGLFSLNCNQPLRWLAAERAERRGALSRKLFDKMHDCVRAVQSQLDKNETLLRIVLDDVSPEDLVELEHFTARYDATHAGLLAHLRDARKAADALESLREPLSQHDVSGVWQAGLEVSEHATRVSDVRSRLWIVKPGVIAGVRQRQGMLLEGVRLRVGVTAGFEGFDDLEAAAEYRAQTAASLVELTADLESARNLQVQETLLGVEQFPDCLALLTPAVRKVRFCAAVWALVTEFTGVQRARLEAPFKQLNIGKLHLQLSEFADRLDELGESAASRELADAPTGGVLRFMASQVQDLLREMPVLAKLRHPGVRQRHWDELGPVLGARFVEAGREDPTLGAVLALRLSARKDDVSPVLERAIQEYAQEVCLEKMEEELRGATVDVAQGFGGLELRALDEIRVLLEEQMVAIGSLLSSPFARAFEGMARTWRDRLVHLGTCLKELVRAQEAFQALEPVFRSPHLQQLLPAEHRQFQSVAATWQAVLNLAAQRRFFLFLCESTLVTAEVPAANVIMAELRTKTTSALDEKRARFPRLHFLTDGELFAFAGLELNPAANSAQPLIYKCFQTLSSVDFDTSEAITGVTGLGGERLVLNQPVITREEPLEKWLAALDAEMRSTLKAGLVCAVDFLESGGLADFCAEDKVHVSRVQADVSNTQALGTRENCRSKEPGGHNGRGPEGLPSQSVGLALRVTFTRRVEKILSREGGVETKRRALQSELKSLQEQMEGLRQIAASGIGGLARVKAKMLMGLGAQLSQILRALIDCPGKVLSPDSFAWQKNLRFYWDATAGRGGACRLETGGEKLSYGFEFTGHQNRAVVTPVTDRCFLGLLSAIANGNCALVTGVLGSGRTESVRALAAAAGKTCLVESATGKGSAERLNGLLRACVASGTWLCLREVGDLSDDVARSLTQSLTAVRQVLTSSGGRVQLGGASVPVDRTVAVFCTAESKNSQAFDRISAFCRTTALGGGPTVAEVAAGLLHTEGFEGFELLGRKLATALQFVSQQLDVRCFASGLQAVHALVSRAVCRRAEMTSAGFEGSGINEEALLAGVLERSLAPGLVGDDLASFHRLLSNLFPGGRGPGDSTGRLKEAIQQAVKDRGLSEVSGTVQKCLQLQGCMELDCLRTVVCGEAGAGKTELVAILARATEKMSGTRVEVIPVDSTNLTSEQLATTCEEILARGSEWEGDTWVVFDGAMGAEAAQTVAARFSRDSRMFALGKLKGNGLKLLFEVDSLEDLTSAVQGQCAIVRVSKGEAVDWSALLRAWVGKHLPECWAEEAAEFGGLCEKALPACLELAIGGAPASLGLVPTGLMQSFLSLLGVTLASSQRTTNVKRPESEPSVGGEGGGRKRTISYGRKQARDLVSWRRLHLKRERGENGNGTESAGAALKAALADVKPSERQQLLLTAAAFALVNSIGLAIPSSTDRKALEHVIRDAIGDLGPQKSPPMPEGSLYDSGYSWQFRAWRSWSELRVEHAASLAPPIKQGFGGQMGGPRFFVSVPETVRNEVLARLILRGGGRLALYGPGGSGKSSLKDVVLQSGADVRKSAGLSGQHETSEGQADLDNRFLVLGSGGVAERCDRAVVRRLRHSIVLPSAPYSFKSLVAIFQAQLAAAWAERASETNGLSGSQTVAPASLSLALSRASTRVHETLHKTLPNPEHGCTLGARDLFKLLDALVQNSDALFRISGTESFSGAPFSDADAVTLWAHEVRRAYGDRVRSAPLRNAVESAIHVAAREHLKGFEHLCQQPKMFGQYSRHADENGDVTVRTVYKEVTDLDGWILGMEGHLAAQNLETENPLPIVLFPEATQHLSRLLRALRGAGAQALLLGPPRCGKKSLLRLAAFVLGFKLFEVGEANGKVPGDWREVIGRAVESAALGDRGVVLGVKAGEPGLSKDIAQLRKGHELLALLSPERRYFIQQEQQRLEEASSTSLISLIDGAEEREAYFNARLVERVNTNLRVAVSATVNTPAAASFFTNCRPFVDECSVDCFDAFSPDALAGIARSHIAQNEALRRFIEFAVVEEDSLARGAAALHARALERQTGVSVASYQELLRAFGALLLDRGGEVCGTLQRLTIGAAKLRSTARLVGDMQSDLEVLLGRRDSTEEEMERLIASISREQDALDVSRAQMQVEQEKAERDSAAATRAAADAQQDVDSVVPLVSRAIKELSTLNKKDIAEIKSLSKPPPRLMIVLEALCILLGKAPKRTRVQQPGRQVPEMVEGYWPVARELLAQVNFVQMLLSFDKDEMDSEVVRKLTPYIQNPDFQPEHVGRISVACKSICIWVRAMYSYHVAKVTKMAPRVERLKEVKHDLENARGALERRSEELRDMEEKIAHLRSRYENARGAKNSLVQQAEDSEVKVSRATRLIGRLEGECARWEKCAEELREAWRGVVGDALLAAGHVAYLGKVPRKSREAQVAAWQGALRENRLAFSEGFSMLRFCADQQTVQEWVAAGLPNDSQSLENAVMVKYSQRWVKVADPQSQAAAWLSRAENGRTPKVVDGAGENLGLDLKSGLESGFGVVVTGDSEALQSVLRSNRVSREVMGTCVVHVANEEVAARCLIEDDVDANCVDFSITSDGVYSQLLALVVEKERPDLEEQRRVLVQSAAALQRQLKSAEEQLLRLVSEASGTILDDAALEDALAAASGTYETIQGRISRVAANETELEATRDRYRPVAERGTLLFATVRDLAQCGPLYERRLGWFKQLYTRGMQRTSALNPVEVSERLTYLTRQMTSVVYCTVAGTLFAEHRTLFGLLLTARILKARGELSEGDWAAFLAGPEIASSSQGSTDGFGDMRKALMQLEGRLPCFSGVVEDVRVNARAWQSYFDRRGVSDAQLPDRWTSKLGPFQRLVLTRYLWPDQVVAAAERCVCAVLEIDPAQAAQRPTVAAAAEQADRLTPVLCAFTPGADPLVEISEYARAKSMSKRMWAVPLGDAAQRERALEVVGDAAKWGKWVVLQDCHVAGPWLDTLQAALEGLKSDPNLHDNFRLWLTTAPAARLPAELLHNSVKLVFEPPQGVRAHLLRLLQQLETEAVAAGAPRAQPAHLAWYRLCLFHAIAVERSRRGKLGWLSSCSFTSQDFQTAKTLLARILAQPSRPATRAESLAPNPQILATDSRRPTPRPPGASLLPTTAEWVLDPGAGAKPKLLAESESAAALAKLAETPEGCVELLGDTVYGGRMADAADRRALRTVLEDCFASGGLIASGVQFVPTAPAPLAAYLEYARALPVDDAVDLLGVRASASRIIAAAAAETLLARAPTLWDATQEPRKGDARQTHSIESEQAASPGALPGALSDLAPTSQKQRQDPVVAQIAQEVRSFNRELDHLRDGGAQRESVKSLQTRRAALAAATQAGAGGSMRLWLPAFRSPQALFAAIAQRSAQQTGLPLDEVTLAFDVQSVSGEDSSAAENETQFCFEGLALEGAGIAGGALIPPGEGDQPTPVALRVVALPRSGSRFEADGMYLCPVYRVWEREQELLGWTRLRSGEKPAGWWEKRQVSIVCRTAS